MDTFRHDFAWLDFGGWISEKRWRAIRRFWGRVNSIMVVTFQVRKQAVTAEGDDPAMWVWKALGKPDVLHIYRYRDMIQIGLRKTGT